MPNVIGTVLDSATQPANGWLRVRASAAFTTPNGLVTTTVATIRVEDGAFPTNFSLPPTPDGVFMEVVEDFDGQALNRRAVRVPDVPGVTYSDLIGAYEMEWTEIDGGDVHDSSPIEIDGGGA